ncbi:MAG: YggS family pyridoxal phosphate-dependent enzyme [bacterium]|nr:YggS family pyridoxal phosphate-dependent enzyme [bacterium]
MSQNSEQADSHKQEGLIPSNQWGHDVSIDLKLVKDNLFEVKNKIAHCKTKIIAVTKYYGLDAVKKGYEAGLRDFGESRAIEAVEKIKQLPDEVRQNSTFHFIGHLQSNKAEKVVEYFDCIHSVDSLKLARVISESACQINKRERILLQVNNAGEEQKFGYSKEELLQDMSELLKLDSIEIVGLMNMAPIEATERELTDIFSDLREFRNKLEKDYDIKLPELSMGMSNDYEIALKEGATMIRIGRKLFT